MQNIFSEYKSNYIMQKKDGGDIRNLSLEELIEHFVSYGDKPFRAKQVWDWLWKKSAHNFDDMTNISLATRKHLKEHFDFNTIKIKESFIASDKTIKFAFQLIDNKIIEGVLIPAENRMTACISTQAGCSLACKFCATGKLGFSRNLTFDEIYDRVILISKRANERFNHNLTNIVFMGMGEPLLNYHNMLKAIERITSPQGLNMSPSRITVSTVGLPKMIKKLGDDGAKFNLALSLHAASDKKRSTIIPVNDQNSLGLIVGALKYYYTKTKNRITIEYLIFDRFNDTLEDAKELADLCRNFPCKVNIIEYNLVQGTGFQKAKDANVKAFADYLESKNMIVNIRKSRGEDIAAACGQLANTKTEVAN